MFRKIHRLRLGLTPPHPTREADLCSAQAKKPAATLQQMLWALDDPFVLAPTLQELGAAHLGYGAEKAQYAVVGDVLLATLGDHVTGWSEADARASGQLYKIASDTMITAARDALCPEAG